MLEELEDGDWEEVFKYADKPKDCGVDDTVGSHGFSREDVSKIYHLHLGGNDYDNWWLLCGLKDGRYAYITAWCDYTGWECQAGGESYVSDSLEHLLKFIPEDERSEIKL